MAAGLANSLLQADLRFDNGQTPQRSASFGTGVIRDPRHLRPTLGNSAVFENQRSQHA